MNETTKRKEVQKYIKTYTEFFGIGEQDVILCTNCGAVAIDLHHVFIKGMGGRKTYEYDGKTLDINGVENIISLCRSCHVKAHSGQLDREYLYKLQENHILNHKK